MARSFWVEAEDFGRNFPGKLDRLFFKVVAEGEVAEHFEEGEVAAGMADVFEVVVFAADADAFLAGGRAGVVPVRFA